VQDTADEERQAKQAQVLVSVSREPSQVQAGHEGSSAAQKAQTQTPQTKKEAHVVENGLLGLTGEQLGIVAICLVVMAILLYLLRLERERNDDMTDKLLSLFSESIKTTEGVKNALENNTEAVKALSARINNRH
jgi:hypothetical protein